MSLEVKVISDINQLITIEKGWESILDQNNYLSIALIPRWFTIWWKIRRISHAKRLHILSCFEGNKLVAIFPFYWCRAKYRGVPIKKLSLMVDGISPHGDFIIIDEKREEAIHAFLNYLASHKELWDIIILDKFRDNYNRGLLLKMLDLYNLNYGIQSSLKTPIITIDKSWDLFWSQRSSKFRQTMRNKLNRLKKYGSVSVERIEDSNELVQILPSIFKISTLSWKGEVNRAITDSPVETAFYRTFTQFGAEKGLVNVWLLKHNGEPIAYEYHLAYNGIIYPLRADFVESYRYLSPGSLLEYYILRNLFEKKECHTYYSCADDYFYLRNWTNGFENLYRVDIFNSGTLSNLLFLGEYRILPKLRKVGILRKVKESVILRREK